MQICAKVPPARLETSVQKRCAPLPYVPCESDFSIPLHSLINALDDVGSAKKSGQERSLNQRMTARY